MSLKKYFFVTAFLLGMQTFAFADGSAVEPRGDFRPTPGFVDAEKLNVRDMAVRLELLLEKKKKKKGDGWYTAPNELSNYFRYNSSDKSLKNQPWKDRWGQTLFLDVLLIEIYELLTTNAI